MVGTLNGCVKAALSNNGDKIRCLEGRDEEERHRDLVVSVTTLRSFRKQTLFGGCLWDINPGRKGSVIGGARLVVGSLTGVKQTGYFEDAGLRTLGGCSKRTPRFWERATT